MQISSILHDKETAVGSQVVVMESRCAIDLDHGERERERVECMDLFCMSTACLPPRKQGINQIFSL